MKRIAFVITAVIIAASWLAGCGGSSPQDRQVKAAQEAERVWKAHEFAKESRGLVKPGMTVREVIKAWGAPYKKAAGAHKMMTWTYKVENIMYYRGWEHEKGAKDQGMMTVNFKDDKVVQVLER